MVPETSGIYRDARADARCYSRDAIEAAIEVFESVVIDPECDEVERIIATDRLAAFTEEIARLDHVDRLTTGTASNIDRTREAWLELARTVRERVEVPDILILAGVPMRRAGTSRGRAEWCGACPVCGEGDDRLRAWGGTNGRLWCRQCHWSTDAIGAASLIVGTGSFRDSVRLLAELSGLEMPKRQAPPGAPGSLVTAPEIDSYRSRLPKGRGNREQSRRPSGVRVIGGKAVSG